MPTYRDMRPDVGRVLYPTYRMSPWKSAVFSVVSHDFPLADTVGTKHVRAQDRYLWSGFIPDIASIPAMNAELPHMGDSPQERPGYVWTPGDLTEEQEMSYNSLRKGRWSEPGREYLVTTVTDQRRSVFADLYCARAFIQELAALESESFCTWLAWVLMPDHFHGLLRLEHRADLSTVIRFLKARSVTRIRNHQHIPRKTWQPGFYDRALRKEDERLAIARYIVGNPLRAGLVRRIAEYPHWDCVWL